jgi:hypothetical protein
MTERLNMTRTIAVIAALALLVPATALGSSRLTFKQARKAVASYQAKMRAEHPDFQYDNQGCARKRPRRIDCLWRNRTHGSGGNSVWCSTRGIVRKSRTGHISLTLRHRAVPGESPFCNEAPAV